MVVVVVGVVVAVVVVAVAVAVVVFLVVLVVLVCTNFVLCSIDHVCKCNMSLLPPTPTPPHPMRCVFELH